ncbi:M15 family metallopeptidase [Rufibacter sediminis]|uniref:D-alanyl-D-alanine dipeptidase n=1 Tax=Rufibacter sediminis TaxID=2762756 RepID=A0ABR6VQP9_9BACT|nr:M15 family metallopeptidase [Rufibacter sediminis]MBC3539471.1 M15 family metallopeptidase [Rufibacter sediminis]
MKKHFFLFLLWTVTVATAHAQAPALSSIPKNHFGLPVVSSTALYQELVAQDPKQELVELASYIPGLVLDIRYATKDNLAGEPVYTLATAYARKPVADALKKIQAELKPLGLGLKIYDGYRPYQVTVQFFEKVKDSVFVASPRTGSRHNRGCAMDLTLIRLRDGKELKMPTAYDAFTPKAHSDYAKLPSKVKQNRDLLKQAMLRHGFQVYPDEWWHFDFKDWRSYPLMDIRFEDLKALKN